jgi:copper chaperone
MQDLVLRIENMHCGACVRRVTQTLNSMAGVQVNQVQIGAARVHLADPAIEPSAVVAAISKAGYPTHLEK